MSPGLAQTPTTQLTIGGQVNASRTFGLQDLQALPAQTQTVSFLSGASSTAATFTGPTLWSLLNETVGLRIDPTTRNDILRSAVIATGSDGYQAVYALGELNPSFGGSSTRPELIAYANTPGRLLTSDGFARTTGPGDIRGGRYVSNVESIAVLHAPRMAGPFAGGPSTQFSVTGQVNASTTFDLARLTALGATTVSTPASGASPAATFTGVPLWTVLQTVGVTTNPAVRNNLLRDFVIATGSDGYQATISLGEINPDFGANLNNPIIVAYATNGGAPGVSLGSSGFARLVVPDDALRGRWVSNLINLELFDVSQWKVLAGESLDMAGFAYRTLGFTLAGGTLTSSTGPATLTAPSYVLNGGTIDVNVTLGATGALTQASGTSVLVGTVATPDVTVAGGTLQLAGNQRLSGTTTLTMRGGTFDLNGFAQTLATLSGTGTVSLSRAAAGGTLTVGAGRFDGSIIDEGTAPGSLVKAGAGTLVLTGTNSYAGGTTVAGGTLVGHAQAFGSGAIRNDASLVLDQAGDAGMANALSGTGSLTKLNTGTLSLTGQSSFTGATAVLGGGLAVNGSLAGSVVTVGQGARLGGTGTVGGVVAQSGATIVPGNSIGTLTVAGNAIFAPASTFQVEANASGRSDRLSATGSATLQGGTVQVLAQNGAYNPRTGYTILSANNSVTGTFAGVTSNLAFLTPTLRYQPTEVDLTLTRNDVAFAAIAQTRNQAAVANAVQGAGAGGGVYDRTVGLTTPEAVTAFQTLTGDIHASSVSAAYETAFFVREAILDRLRWSGDGTRDYGRLPATYTADLPGRAAPVAPVPVRVLDPRVFGLWGQGFGSFGQARSDGNAVTLNRDTAGFMLGADVRLESGIRLGVAGGYTRTNLDAPGQTASGTIESGFGGVYGGYEAGPFALRLGAVYADNSLRLRRSVVFPGFSETESARYGGSTVQGFGEIGYRIALGAGGLGKGKSVSYIEPFVGGAYVGINRDRFAETGGVAALTGASRLSEIPTLTAGVRGQTEVDLGVGTPVSLHGLVGYRRAFGEVIPTALLTFGTGPSFVTAGIPITRDALIASAGVDLRVSAAATLGVSYTGQVGSRAEDHAVKGAFIYRF